MGSEQPQGPQSTLAALAKRGTREGSQRVFFVRLLINSPENVGKAPVWGLESPALISKFTRNGRSSIWSAIEQCRGDERTNHPPHLPPLCPGVVHFAGEISPAKCQSHRFTCDFDTTTRSD